MNLSLVTTLSDAIFKEGKDIVTAWFAVITKGRRALAPLELEDSRVVLYALRFMLYMIATELIIKIPASAAIGVRFESAGYVIAFIVATYVELLSGCFILHGAMKVFGGKGTLQGAVSAFGFLTAYLPLLWVLYVPMQLTLAQAMSSAADPGMTLAVLRVLLREMSAWNVSVLVVVFLAGTAILAVFLTSVIGSFRTMHRLSRSRAALASAIGLVVYAIFVVMFVAPFFASIYAGFQRPS